MTDTTTQVQELFERGAHYAYSKARRHPSAEEFIFGAKDGVELFDLEKTIDALQGAEEFLSATMATGKQVLFVATKNEAKRYVRESAEALGMPYVTERWIGGTLTNFKQIQSRVERLEELREDKEKGLLKEKYTKKEQLLLDREIADLEKKFGGLVSMKKLPAALVIVDPQHENTAVSEALHKNIPIVALLSSNADFSQITYPVPANHSNHKTVAYVIDRLQKACAQGSAQVTQKASEEVEKK